MEVKNVMLLPSDSYGCGMYRLQWPGQSCMAAGKPILIQQRTPKIVVDAKGNVQGINVGNYNVVVLQRPGSYQIPQVIDILHDNGVKVVIDMDDSMSKIDPRNPVYKNYDPRTSQKRNWMNMAASCAKADLVTCTSEALAEEYGSHGRVKIIRNHVPKRYLDISRQEREVPVVTWAGWTLTHPGDLAVTHGMINQVITETGATFMAYGDLNIFQELQIRYSPPNFYKNFEEVSKFASNLALADIGIVPLKMTPFNEAKSFLKCLEYAALGVVPVASPTPENLFFAELGGCIIAEKPADWHREVKELILDNEKRAEMSKRVREIASEWTIEENWNLWWEAWAE